MAERPISPFAQELAPLHERGGLTPDHWETLLNIDYSHIARWNNEDIERVEQYANAVLGRKIEDANFNHRKYLDSDNWNAVVRNLDWFIRRSEEGFKLFRRERPELSLMRDIYVYALLESRSSVSLRKILESQPKHDSIWKDVISISGYPERKEKFVIPVWSETDHAWHYKIRTEWTERGTYHSWTERHDEYKTEGTENYIDQILSVWCLNPEQIRDPIHTSPEELTKILTELVDLNDTSIVRNIYGNNNWHFSRRGLNPYLETELNLRLYKLGSYTKVITETLKNRGVNTKNKVEFARTLASIFNRHFGFLPYVLVGTERTKWSSNNGIWLYLSKERAMRLYNSRENPIVVEGDIENDEELPLFPITHNLAPIPQAA